VSLASKCKAVICCRVSPIQKAQVVQAVKERVQSITLAVGDGANDVSMIQTAHVGVGISGLEGLQAARASDYSIGQFHYLRRLLLVHGRWSYRRIAKLVVFSFYKNASLYLTQLWFTIHAMFSGQSLYDAWALAMYNLSFTAAPIMALAIFDRDVEASRVLDRDQFPELFQDGLKNRLFNTTEFWKYTLTAIVHSLVSFYLSMYCFVNGSDVEAGTGRNLGMPGAGIITYTGVLMIVTLKCGLETNSWNVFNFFFTVGSVYSWFLFLIVYCSFWSLFGTASLDDFAIWYGADTRALNHPALWLITLLVTVLALLRDVVYKYLKKNYDPGLVHIIQNFEAEGEPFDRHDVRHAAPWLFPKHEVKEFKPTLAEGMGSSRFTRSESGTVGASASGAFLPSERSANFDGPTSPRASDRAPLLSTTHVFLPASNSVASPGRRRQRIGDIIDDDVI